MYIEFRTRICSGEKELCVKCCKCCYTNADTRGVFSVVCSSRRGRSAFYGRIESISAHFVLAGLCWFGGMENNEFGGQDYVLILLSNTFTLCLKLCNIDFFVHLSSATDI